MVERVHKTTHFNPACRFAWWYRDVPALRRMAIHKRAFVQVVVLPHVWCMIVRQRHLHRQVVCCIEILHLEENLARLREQTVQWQDLAIRWISTAVDPAIDVASIWMQHDDIDIPVAKAAVVGVLHSS
jgi:hypothetical protein